MHLGDTVTYGNNVADLILLGLFGVIDKMAELDRNAAISAGDIAEAMSRANVSAQLAGSEINKYMSYICSAASPINSRANSLAKPSLAKNTPMASPPTRSATMS